MDYSKLSEITVKTQEELDAIPDDFMGRIYIDGGTPFARIYVKKRYYFCVEAWENSSVVARENSSVVARGNSSVEARENSSVEARENSSVVARGNSSVVARGNSSVVAWENSSVEAWENSSVEAWENSSVVARGNSSVEAWENSSVVARGNSSVEARGNSSVVAWGNSSVVASANAQIVDMLQGSKIKISGNARIVYMPKNIFKFMDFYGIKHTKTKATFYKSVHKTSGGIYFSDHNQDYVYELGQTYKEECDTEVTQDCGRGLHIAHLDWALKFGCGWSDLAILEVETKISDIVMPKNTDGKVRTSSLKVLREVPLEECGVLGKILSKRQERNES